MGRFVGVALLLFAGFPLFGQDGNLPPLPPAAQPGELVLPAIAPPKPLPEEVAPTIKVPAPVAADNDDGKPKSILPIPLPKPDKIVPKFWTGGFEVGLSGAEGNTNNFKFRTAFNNKFESDPHFWQTNINYSYSNVNSEDVENRALGKTRYEYLFKDTPWSWYTSGEIEYDEFRAFLLRLAGHTGAGYAFIKTYHSLLKGRLGAGASRKIGGPSNDTKPELDFGLDAEFKLTARQKITATADYYPNVASWVDFRAEARVNYEILIDPDWNLTLKLGMIDRYDNSPEGKKPNDVEYFTTLLWKY